MSEVSVPRAVRRRPGRPGGSHGPRVASRGMCRTCIASSGGRPICSYRDGYASNVAPASRSAPLPVVDATRHGRSGRGASRAAVPPRRTPRCSSPGRPRGRAAVCLGSGDLVERRRRGGRSLCAVGCVPSTSAWQYRSHGCRGRAPRRGRTGAWEKSHCTRGCVRQSGPRGGRRRPRPRRTAARVYVRRRAAGRGR